MRGRCRDRWRGQDFLFTRNVNPDRRCRLTLLLPWLLFRRLTRVLSRARGDRRLSSADHPMSRTPLVGQSWSLADLDASLPQRYRPTNPSQHLPSDTALFCCVSRNRRRDISGRPSCRRALPRIPDYLPRCRHSSSASTLSPPGQQAPTDQIRHASPNHQIRGAVLKLSGGASSPCMRIRRAAINGTTCLNCSDRASPNRYIGTLGCFRATVHHLRSSRGHYLPGLATNAPQAIPFPNTPTPAPRLSSGTRIPSPAATPGVIRPSTRRWKVRTPRRARAARLMLLPGRSSRGGRVLLSGNRKGTLGCLMLVVARRCGGVPKLLVAPAAMTIRAFQPLDTRHWSRDVKAISPRISPSRRRWSAFNIKPTEGPC